MEVSVRKYTIVLPDEATFNRNDIDISVLEEFGTVINYPLTEPEELADRIKSADIILCNKSLVNRETVSDAKNLKYVGITATGYNNVDLEYTNSRNIIVSNVPGYSTDSVAQHTFALILNHYNRVSEYEDFVSKDGWKKSKTFSPFIYEMHELCGRTIGIIGFGEIGQKVADIARAFSMKILVYSRNDDKVKNILQEKFYGYQNICYAELEEIAAKSDIVTVHCPLNKESDKMINDTFLKNCKKNCYFVNTARGGVVDEKALIKALNEEWIAGAGIDVLNNEPMLSECELQKAKNITITPHVAWAPLETRQRLFDMVVENLRAFVNGCPENVVRK